ncbi:MAG: hypothetical protein ACFFBP_05550 [Promethearchaeota archaeon]
MLSPIGWINGLSVSGIVVIGIVIGFFGLFYANKFKAKLLYYSSLILIFISFMWLGNFTDFITILLTSKNMDNSYGLYSYLNLMWLGPIIIVGSLAFTELIFPDKKYYIFSLAIIFAIVYELILYIFLSNSITFTYPDKIGEDLIDEEIGIFTPFGITIIFAIILIFIMIFGFFIKSFQSEGIIRKKLLLISIGYFLFLLFAVLDGLISNLIAVVFFRIGVIIGMIIYYFGIREESIEKPKINKEIEIEGNLLRFAKISPGKITEEQVMFYKEQKVCLICKAKALRFIYVCSKCDALYCEKCARALSNLENVCWVCNQPINESKPSNPFSVEKDKSKFSDDIKKRKRKNKSIQQPKN